MLVWISVFFKQKTAYEMRISDWSSDVCSSDLRHRLGLAPAPDQDSRFLARATNTDLTLGQELSILAIAMLTSKSASGVTSAGFIPLADRKSVVSGKSVSVRVDLSGRRIIKTKNDITKVVSTLKKNNKQT